MTETMFRGFADTLRSLPARGEDLGERMELAGGAILDAIKAGFFDSREYAAFRSAVLNKAKQVEHIGPYCTAVPAWCEAVERLRADGRTPVLSNADHFAEDCELVARTIEHTGDCPARGIGGQTVAPSCWWRCAAYSGFGVALIVTLLCSFHVLSWNWAGCSGVSLVLIVILLWCIHRFPWVWMRDHKNALPIQIAACLLIVWGSAGLFFPSCREWVWWGGGSLGAVGLVALILNKLS